MKVLVAEDEPQVRALLRRVLEHLGFDVVEAHDGIDAVSRATEEKPQVILMDLAMPRMDGVQAIRTLKSSPATSEIPVVVLTAYAESARVKDAIAAGAKDFLVKSGFQIDSVLDRIRRVAGPVREPSVRPVPEKGPLEPGDAASEPAPKQARKARTKIDPTEVRRMLERVMELKALPFVAAELIKMTDAAGSDARAVTGVIERDQALTARVLRLSNSAFYALHGRIHNLTQAIARIGMRGVREIALAVSLVQEYSREGKGGLDRLAFWKHSLACATLAKEITTVVGLPPEQVEEAFLAGLLHDIGKAILDEQFGPEHAAARAEALKGGRPLHEAELGMFGMDHTHVARFVLEKWKLPEGLWDPIARHHESWESIERDAGANRKTIGAVWAANVLAKAGRYGSGGSDVLEEIPDALASTLKLDAERVTELMEKADEQVTELTQILLLHDEKAAAAMPKGGPPAATRSFRLVREVQPKVDALAIALLRAPLRAVKEGEAAQVVVVAADSRRLDEVAQRPPEALIWIAEASKEAKKEAKKAGATILSAPVSLVQLGSAMEGGKKGKRARSS